MNRTVFILALAGVAALAGFLGFAIGRSQHPVAASFQRPRPSAAGPRLVAGTAAEPDDSADEGAELLQYVPLAEQAAAMHPIDKALFDVEQEHGLSSESAAAYARAADKWDKELARRYERLLAGCPPELQASLRDADKAWSAFRDAQTRVLDLYYASRESRPGRPGVVARAFHAGRAMTIVRRRAQDLDFSVEDQAATQPAASAPER